ncbi:MAG: glycoside hydrolase [Polyangiaceae bacterium]|nr:glycoside hydrolase [Polyangiaceae bacterium]
MKHHAASFSVVLLLAAALVLACTKRSAPPPGPASLGSAMTSAPPPDGSASTPAAKGSFATNQYRDLFAELGKPAVEIRAKVEAAYQQLFHGDPANEAVMFAAGSNAQGPLAHIKDIGHDDVRSEGISYGMIIAVELDRKQDFDALWNWATTYMRRSDAKHPAHGFFSWQMRADGTALDEMPAPDAEEYFVTALFFASHRWGDGQGIYEYGREARELLDAMKNRAPITGTVNRDRTTTGVALFNPEHKMVRFTPDTGNFAKNGDHTDPSYHLPAFYELWARWGPEADRAFWTDVACTSRDFFVEAAHPETGLCPDYANFDGTPKAASWDAHTADFRWDAWRTAMNWSIDAAWWGKDPRQIELSDRLLAFFDALGPTYPGTFTLDGTPTGKDSSLGLIATNAVAALAASHPRAKGFVERLYEAKPPVGKWRYYDGLLYLMAMLHLSGNFRIYAPSSAPASVPAAAPSPVGETVPVSAAAASR